MPIFDDLHGNLNDDFLADDPDNLKNLFIINNAVSCVNKSVENVYIPRNVKSIPYLGFSDCINLKSLHLPDNISNVEREAFSNCESLKEIVFLGSMKELNKKLFVRVCSIF